MSKPGVIRSVVVLGLLALWFGLGASEAQTQGPLRVKPAPPAPLHVDRTNSAEEVAAAPKDGPAQTYSGSARELGIGLPGAEAVEGENRPLFRRPRAESAIGEERPVLRRGGRAGEPVTPAAGRRDGASEGASSNKEPIAPRKESDEDQPPALRRSPGSQPQPGKPQPR